MSIGPFQLIIVLVIVIAIFGTKKLGNLGTDLGTAIKGFKNAIKEDEKPEEITPKPVEKITSQNTEKPIIEGEVKQETDQTKQG